MELDGDLKRQIEDRGMRLDRIQSQLEMFERGSPPLTLARACTVGDGIMQISEKEQDELVSLYEKLAPGSRLFRFVPASGAASRMFRTLLRFKARSGEILRERVRTKAEAGDEESRAMLTFMEGIRRFAFYDELSSAMADEGLDTEALIGEGRFGDIVDVLVADRGLGYAGLPKGLILFHRYKGGARTAFEEHLVEATGYGVDRDGECPMHFTVSPEHEKRFLELFRSVKPAYEDDYHVRYDVDFSRQEPRTDTIAVDSKNRPFVKKDGSILFRPGGHGALLENLNRIKAELLFIKNIDNVVPDRLKEPGIIWKKILGGLMLRLRERLAFYVKGLAAHDTDAALVRDAMGFAREALFIRPPEGVRTGSIEAVKSFLLGKFERPLRVCGMVKNEGEPGGGPFWVRHRDGGQSLQIVESAQVDPDSPEQKALFRSATHFNPVDIVCSTVDHEGRPFDLERYVDEDAFIITKKSEEGRDLKALELPGLWNGSMSDWNTVFVEVPGITFNPVKTVNDLLRESHLNDPEPL